MLKAHRLLANTHMEEITKELTNEEKALRKEAFLVGYGASLQKTHEILSGIVEEIEETLAQIKKQLEENEEKDETKKDEEEKGE